MSRIVIMGPPGAGKGTQGIRLAKVLSVPHIASGDLLRRVMATAGESDLAKAAHVINHGHLVSDEVASSMIFGEIAEAPGFVLDGFPRTVSQASLMRSHLREQARPLRAVLYLHVDEDEILARLGGRLTCVNCGESYHREHEQPRLAGICDRCEHALEVRPDDDPERIRTRLRLYRERTAPVVGWYEEHGLLRHIDAAGTPDEVFEQCIDAIMDS